MTVLIKDVKIPRDCSECLEIGWHYVFECQIDDMEDGKRFEFCPLEEVPTPHGRLIDADELLELYEPAPEDANEWEHYTTTISVVRQTIKDMPTVIEAEEEG